MGKRVHGGRPRGNASRLYSIWTDMKSRCFNPNDTAFSYYGGRGIGVCDEWKYDYSVFRDWAISNGYSESLTLDRLDNNGHYSPLNCAWKTRKEQMRNSRVSKQFIIEGESKTLIEWSEDSRCEVKYSTLKKRSSQGWPINMEFIKRK